MNQLNIHCGCCGKPVGVVDDSGDLNVLHGTLKECPKCGGECIQGDQVILRDTVMDRITVVKVTPRPVVKVEPVIETKPDGLKEEEIAPLTSAESVANYTHYTPDPNKEPGIKKPDVAETKKVTESVAKPSSKKKTKGFFKRKN